MMGSCLMGTEFQFQIMKKIWRPIAVMGGTQYQCSYWCSTLQLKMFKMATFMTYIFYND